MACKMTGTYLFQVHMTGTYPFTFVPGLDKITGESNTYYY